MMPAMMPTSPEQQKAELYTIKKQVEASLAVANEHSETLAKAMEQFQKAATGGSNWTEIEKLDLLASGLKLFTKAQKLAVDSNIAVMEAQKANVEKALRHLESPLHLPIMNPYPPRDGR